MESSPATTPGDTRKMIAGIAILWALFQLWYASPLPFVLNFGVLNDTEARSIHLAFAILLAFLTNRPQCWKPLFNGVLALAAAFCAAYMFLFYDDLANRSGLPSSLDVVVAISGLLLLLEATRRVLGWPLVIVVVVFLTYTLAGPYMPAVIAHQGASLNKLASHQWLGTEGVFGVALGVSTEFVFLFVLFGALMEKAGAGQYFLQTSFALLGHLRGGPAKAAVVSSGLSGIISGSSIANVVTTGTFTIPLMKKVGFPASKAGAIEVAASTNGQLTPPVMGAAAFLMVEYVGISYIEVIRHAILPALISYGALLFIVHLEACKAGMQGLPKTYTRPLLIRLLMMLSTLLVLMLLTLAVYYGVGWIKTALPETATWVVAVLVVTSFLALLKYSSHYPLAEISEDELIHLPDTVTTIKSGLHYLLPIAILLWCLTVERLSPSLSAFWATLFMLFITLTQHPLQVMFNQQGDYTTAWKTGLNDLTEGLRSGGMNMISIGVATATAGIVVGTVTLTGIGLVMTGFVEFISGGNLLLILIFTAVICLILGMGLPTTANYIVVSTLMAPVIVTLGAENGLIIPLVAAHMFVFYFGILADDTPPVGLAAYAAAGIAGADPIRTGLQGFAYDIRTAILPFMFIFNTQLLLIGIDSILELLVVVATAFLAMLAFAAATQHYWLTRNRLWETLALLLIAFTLFRPGFWWDKIYPPIETLAGTEIHQVAQSLPANKQLNIVAQGETLEGEQVEKHISLNIGNQDTTDKRLAEAGLYLRNANGKELVDVVSFGSNAERIGLATGWEITQVLVESERPSRYWMVLPALLLLGVIYLAQSRRGRKS